MFSSVITDHWLPADGRLCPEGGARVVVDPGLSASRSVSLLRVENGPTVLSLSPPRAGDLRLSDGECVDVGDLTGRLERAGVSLNDPDDLFYLTTTEQVIVRDSPWDAQTRRLTGDDGAAFAALTAAAPADDLDKAFVELDHWLVVGTFVGAELVSVASAYPWRETRLADIGVITLPGFRGRGLARSTVRAISAAALERGHEPQYRCQLDNTASVALARSAGFTLFGEWDVIDAD